MTQDKNLCNKTRDVDKPYEIWEGVHPLFGKAELRVLKKYQKPSIEAKNEYARWFVAVKSQATFGTWDMGDTYIKDILPFYSRTFVDPSLEGSI